MSPEMIAIVNEWLARKQQIQRRRLNDPNYEPQSHEFDPVILEPNFFQRHPYMRQYVDNSGDNNEIHLSALTFTSIVEAFFNHIFVCWVGFGVVFLGLILFGIDLSTAWGIAALGCLVYGVVRLWLWSVSGMKETTPY
ncbi:hypothetical protein EG328_002280 [Venturia inaequalis]|uniref:Uncharacterized protein n=1 Tax=Venturia inaequalis TaxID=5025 RepID=A0A8H3UUX3_VENIN|nr:hypothetical protein EG328_002280 [Venturia inaequalis]